MKRSSKLHIVVLVDELLHDNMILTGAARCVLEAARIIGRTHRISVIGSSTNGFSHKKYSENIQFFSSGTDFDEQLLLIEKLNEKVGIDLLLPVLDQSIPISVSAREKIQRNIPIIYWSHYSPENYETQHSLGTYISDLNGIITPTLWESKRIAKQWGIVSQRLFVVPNGIKPPNIHLKKNNSQLLFIGRRSLDKGYDFWLSSCYTLLNKRRDLKFVTVGFDYSRNTLTNYKISLLAAGSLIEYDYLSTKEIWQQMSQSAALVLPSRKECAPICVIEAMHIGLPIITTPLPNLLELSGNSSVFEFVSPPSPAGFAESANSLLDSPNKSTSLAILAKVMASSIYTDEVMGNNLIKVFQETI